MNDTDRGAYTPGGERPLAFDARSGRGGGRAPVPLALVGSATVLVVVVVGLVLAYRGDNRGAGAAPRTVGEPVGAIKTAAAPEAATAEASAGAGVYSAQDVPVAKPSFAPPPEAPAARPAPTSLTVNTVDPAKVRIGAPLVEPAPTAADRTASASAATAVKSGAADAPAPPIRTVSRPVQVAAAAAAPVTTTTTTAVKPAKSAAAPALHTSATTVTKTEVVEAPTAAKIAKAEAVPAATGFKGAGVQIGAFSSRELADKGFADAMAAAGKGGHGKAVEPVDHDGKTLYRTTVTGFADRAAAKAFCEALTAKGHSCIVKG